MHNGVFDLKVRSVASQSAVYYGVCFSVIDDKNRSVSSVSSVSSSSKLLFFHTTDDSDDDDSDDSGDIYFSVARVICSSII